MVLTIHRPELVIKVTFLDAERSVVRVSNECAELMHSHYLPVEGAKRLGGSGVARGGQWGQLPPHPSRKP